MPSSAHSLRDSGRWFIARPPALGSSPLSVLFAGEGTEPCLSRQVCCRFEARLSSRRTRLSWQPPTPGRGESLWLFSSTAVPSRLGSLRQTPLRRAEARAPLPGPLHAPRRYFESPA